MLVSQQILNNVNFQNQKDVFKKWKTEKTTFKFGDLKANFKFEGLKMSILHLQKCKNQFQIWGIKIDFDSNFRE